VILDTGFQSSFFQSFGLAGWILDVAGSHSRFILENPASNIQHRALKIEGLTSTPHDELDRSMQRYGFSTA